MSNFFLRRVVLTRPTYPLSPTYGSTSIGIQSTSHCYFSLKVMAETIMGCTIFNSRIQSSCLLTRRSEANPTLKLLKQHSASTLVTGFQLQEAMEAESREALWREELIEEIEQKVGGLRELEEAGRKEEELVK